MPPSHRLVLCSLSSSSMCLSGMQSPFSLCCRYLGFFRAIGPITVAVLGIAITNIWHLECPTSDKNKVRGCVRACVRACVCVCDSLFDCNGCKLDLSSCVSVLRSLSGVACKHASRVFVCIASYASYRLPCCQPTLCLCSAACKTLPTNVNTLYV